MSLTPETSEIAVVGAGVVGLSVALRLQTAGHAVTLIAPEDLGDGASYGNAGAIADYAVMPIGSPEVLRNLPQLLFNRDSPLAIRRAAIPSLAPWLLRFARQSLPAATQRNATAIAALLAESVGEWHALADQIGGQDVMVQRGSFYFFETEREMAAGRSGLKIQQGYGIKAELIDRDALYQMEPGLPANAAVGAVLFPNTISMTDPGTMIRHLIAATQAAGVQRVFGQITALSRGADGVTLSGPGVHLRAKTVVIAAGAHSRPLARAAGDRVPLDTERGYHLEFDMDTPPLTRSATPVSRGFYFFPMRGRLRVAGTVELGGLHAPPSPRRLAVLERGARAIFPDLPPPARSWMGFRPSLPDSRPVIGPSRIGRDVIYAFGHGHLGLTMAPITARLVAEIIAGTPPSIDITPYLPTRF
jgi:glycine/D-amino acid oxidase-like deaminating enzyme